MLRGHRTAVATLTLALAFAFSCTRKNPSYCATDSDCPGRTCNMTLHACNPFDGGAADARDGGDGGDAADARDGGDGGDTRDASDAADGPFKCKMSQECMVDGGGFDGSAAIVCEVEAGACVECLADKDCTQKAKPICDLASRTCGPCTTDAQCAAKDPTGPGVCMFHQDGRCATDAETIYVKNATPGCSMTPGGGGTKDVPYCLSQDGVNAVTNTKRLVVLRGPDPLSYWSASFSGEQVSVIGQGSASIAPGSFIGIHLTGGNAFIRNVKVTGGSSTGVVADSGAELHLDGCIVEGNVLGGIKIDSATFDITNTVIAKNTSTSTTGCGGWAGACFNNVIGTPRFLNNTVVSNMGTGTACNNSATTIVGSIEFGNTPDNSTCTVTTCCTGNPMLTTDYHLTSNSSACIDQLDPAMSTTHDFDGQLRPRGTTAKSDCGADEF